MGKKSKNPAKAAQRAEKSNKVEKGKGKAAITAADDDDAAAVAMRSSSGDIGGEDGGGASKKRRQEDGSSITDRKVSKDNCENEEDLVFEDPFADELEEEEIDDDENDDDAMVEDDAAGGNGNGGGGSSSSSGGGGKAAGASQPSKQPAKVWRPGVDQLEEGEELEFDPSAYHMYHCIRPEWPCLSFDIVKDKLGSNRSRFPHTIYAVAGTQADRADRNKLTIMKLSELSKTYKEPNDDDDDDDNDDDDDDDDVDTEPVLEHINIPHKGGVNRVRCMPQNSGFVSSWSDTGHVHIWDFTSQITALEKGGTRKTQVKPVHSFNGHPDEGFAMAWSPLVEGKLITGDCSKYIYQTLPGEGGTWQADTVPFVGHTASVEDLAWSPTERTVFASASADKTVRIWDTRKKTTSMLNVQAHPTDVNVLSWNTNVTYLLVSGGDEGAFKVWDLRSFSETKPEPVAQFKWHKGPITSIEWHPTDESMLACTGADNLLTLWDLSVEADDDDDEEGGGAASQRGEDEADVPAQLLFVHQGQLDMKELHFHPQIPGVIMSTALDSFNIFKPATTT